MRTAAEEKRICIGLARHYLNGGSALVTAESLARFLFEQREAARKHPLAVELTDELYDEIEVLP